MKKKNLFMALAAICAGVTFASCTNDLDGVAELGQLTDPTNGVALSITKVGTSEMTNVTRATATEVNEWATAPDKNIGIIAVVPEEDGETMTPLRSGSGNMKWTYNPSSGKWNAQKPLVMYPDDMCAILAYYPYSESGNILEQGYIEVDATKDYMYSDIAMASFDSPEVELCMHHINTQIRVNLIRKGYTGAGQVTNLTIKSNLFASAAKVSPIAGYFDYVQLPKISGNTGILAEDISVNPTAKMEAAYAWFVPIVNEEGSITIDITIDGVKRRFNANQTFEPGCRYTFNLTVRDTDQLVLSNIEVDPWINNPIDGEADPFIPAESKAIDLGLPSGLKWAAGNLGAENETDPGLYYMWGDTEGHEKDSGYNFSSANYSGKGLDAISADLTLEQDAAHVRLGGNWRMPTKAEFEELYNNTNVTWTTINGVAGRKFANKTDASKYIFMPAAGNYSGYSGSSLNDWGSNGYYWSSTFRYSSEAYDFYFRSDGWCYYSHSCYYGMPVRAVCE